MKGTWIVIALFAAARGLPSPVRRLSNVMDDTTIRTAVSAWLSDSASAEATYGHISTWETGGVTDMSDLFCGQWGESQCNWPALNSFNDDISAWDTSGVTSMERTFAYAPAFNQDIGDWAVHSVTSMNRMLHGASAFNQDISGWAVDSVMDMEYMFRHAEAFDQTSAGAWTTTLTLIPMGKATPFKARSTTPRARRRRAASSNANLKLRMAAAVQRPRLQYHPWLRTTARYERPSRRGSQIPRPPRRRTAISRRGRPGG